ncbi:hypothetical protein RUM43_013532 [Polyplax serrata]|uniref:Uncharacterized protein n=1 Tax=Polyplax serrata TaxID=468196 RepID=A0AAN8P589_POLSC
MTSLGHHSEHHPGQTERGVITKEEDKRLISTLSVVVNPEEVFGFTSTVLEKSKVEKGWFQRQLHFMVEPTDMHHTDTHTHDPKHPKDQSKHDE